MTDRPSPACSSLTACEISLPRECEETDPVHRCFPYGPGVCVRYETHGNGPQPVLFLHGLAASRTTWDDLRELFPRENYTLYLIDLPGFGSSSKPRNGAYGPVEQAEVILSLLADQKLSGVILVGHSYGGTIALMAPLMACRSSWQHLFSRVILIGAPAWPQPLPRFLRWLSIPLIGTLLLRFLPNRLVVTRALKSVYNNQNLIDERHRVRYADSFRGADTIHALARTVQQLLPDQWESICADYPHFCKPLLLLWGKNDRVVKLWQGELLRDTIPGAQLVIIDQCGHNPHEECPEETWQIIRQFLDQ